MKKKSNKEKILTLCPQVNNNEINVKYADMLDLLLKDKDCHNIALLGPYGSGKSSIIKTYFDNKKRLKKKSLTITIGSYINDFKLNEKENADGVINNGEQGLVNEVEKSILKQIIFTNKFSKFPKSTLIRFDKISKKTKVFHFICLLLIILFIGYHIFKLYDIDITFKLLWDTFGLFGVVISLVLGYYLYRFVESAINEVKINKIKISDCEIEFKQDNDSLFSRYLTEIVYFFKCTNYSIVVFEDLDRFPEDVALKIIQELKELNTILNNADSISKLVFLYAINDNIFSKVEDKNKFYDYNLSVLPISTSFNAELNLVGLLKFKSVYDDISSNLIGIVSKYVYDMRMLKNIVNDYCLFKSITNTKNYDKLFAMVVYKNFYYKEYNKLGSIDDELQELFKTSDNKKKDLIDLLLSKKEEKYKQIEKVNEDNIYSINEMKRLLLSYNHNYSYSSAVTGYFLGSGSQMSISNFLSESFDLDELSKNTFELYRNGRISENDVFKNFESKEKFLNRCNDISIKYSEKINDIKLEISKIDEEINLISNYKIKDVFKKYFDSFDFNEISLKVELISCGFIEDDYMDYITAPVIYGENDSVESLKYSDSQFLMNIRQNRYSFDLKIIGFKTIIERVKNNFSSEYILNYDFIDYLMRNSEYDDYVKIILEQFRVCNIEMLKFLIEFLRRYSYHSNAIFYYFKNNNIDIWKQCFYCIEKMSYSDIKDLIIEMLYQEEYITILEDIDSFKTFVEDLLKLDDLNTILDDSMVEENLLILKPRFTSICLLDKSKFYFLYSNNLYRFTKENLSYIADYNVVDVSTLYNTNKTKDLINYIENNLLFFCREFYISNEVKFNNAKLVKKVLDYCVSDVDVIKQIYIRESFVLNTLSGVPKTLFNELLDYNHVVISWENIFGLFGYVDDKKLFSFVDKEIVRLLTTKLCDNNKKNSFFEQYIVHLLRTNVKLCKRVVKYFNVKYSELNLFTDLELTFLVDNNCVSFEKKNYKVISKRCSIDERNKYVFNFYNNASITYLLNSVSCEDIITLCTSSRLDNDKKLELLYGLYKKEKRSNVKNAYNNFVDRFKYIYSIGFDYSFKCRNIIYTSVLKQMKNDGLFDLISISKNDIISFKIK